MRGKSERGEEREREYRRERDRRERGREERGETTAALSLALRKTWSLICGDCMRMGLHTQV